MNIDKLLESIPYEKLYPIKSNMLTLILLSVSLLVAAALYFLLVQGSNEEISVLNTNLADMKRKIVENKTHIAKRVELEAHVTKLEEGLAISKQQLPTEKEIPDLLEQISNMGLRFGLEFASFVPGKESLKEFYAEVPISLSVYGGYHQIVSFLDEISRIPRIVTIKNIKMKTKASSGKQGAYQGIILDCQAITYRYTGPTSVEDLEKTSDKGN
ncbi:MAG: type 4a pilus biogenesis protein PilO [Nitrospinota bacterium]